MIHIPVSLSSFSQSPTGYIHHLPISATHCRYEVLFIYCFHFCACILPIWNSFKKSLLGNMRSRIDLDSFSQFTAKFNWLCIHETSLIGLRSESKWLLYNSAPDACIVTEPCMRQYETLLLKASKCLVGIFYAKGEFIHFFYFSSQHLFKIILKSRGTMTLELIILWCL